MHILIVRGAKCARSCVGIKTRVSVKWSRTHQLHWHIHEIKLQGRSDVFDSVHGA